MLVRRGIGMAAHEMVEYMQQRPHMVAFTACLRGADIVDDHPADRLISMGLVRQIVAIGGGDAFGDMFVLGYGKDFLLAEIAHADNVFERYHRHRKP